ncbi:hypothetical protein [Jannaschia pohangensis]|uniref:Uncharacterized protein n=1 Tax=Jannaschia pohangensis TaxID=390807 RepID=A0A1I3V1J0_9RHOB|nr:hypothetical protein [Jannaschia pohangensis]SFJ89095.1 hypothetical protein SAMN04488095_0064 [Jannaschia pohangensis]
MAQDPDIQDALARALSEGALPQDARATAQKILTRLETPVRVTLMGPPGSGKSRVLALLAGADIVPDGVRLPTLELVQGTTVTPRARITLPDGTVKILEEATPEIISAFNPVFVEQKMDLPALGKISLLEVVTGPSDEELTRAALWAAKRTDVAIWCTRRYRAPERTIWNAMPEVLKDHAVLLVTHAEEFGDADARAAALEPLEEAVGEDFIAILPIDTPEALAARGEDGNVDRDRFRASGGQALISTVLREVKTGRQSMLDQAEILLRRNGIDPARQPHMASEPTMVPTPLPPIANPAVSKAARPADSLPAELRPSEATRAAFEAAIARLSKTGAELVAETDMVPAAIMKRSVREMQWLSDHLDDVEAPGDPVLISLRDSAMEATDMLQLMQMEKTDSSAVEAISLMIQLRRSLHQGLHLEGATLH